MVNDTSSLGGAGAGDVAPSFKLCGDGDDDNAVVFICAMGFIGGSLMWTGMAGEGASRPPPAPAPECSSLCAVWGKGFRTRLLAISWVAVVVVVVGRIGASEQVVVDMFECCLLARSEVSSVRWMISRVAEAEFGRLVGVSR